MRYQVRLDSHRIEKLIVVTLTTEYAPERFNAILQYKLKPVFTSKIDIVGDGRWQANFNNRNLVIGKAQSGIKVIDLDTHEAIEGDELRSVKNFLDWHVRSRRTTSEVARLWTTR